MAKIVYVVRVLNHDPDAYRANMDGHRAWINKHADASFVLCGPFEDRSAGGMILAQAESRAALDRILAEDPLIGCGAATHEVAPLEISRGYLADALR
ncbi:MAG TPA: YciI family protein [Candidatus Lustribacter sp.]|jgi:uncharacterized protein YciI|nr:YciI family protein [Candidatus Lustribacter sp.]